MPEAVRILERAAKETGRLPDSESTRRRCEAAFCAFGMGRLLAETKPWLIVPSNFVSSLKASLFDESE
jgi:hypothetical protein